MFNAVKGINQIKTEIGPLEFIIRKVFDDLTEIFTTVQLQEEAWVGRLWGDEKVKNLVVKTRHTKIK